MRSITLFGALSAAMFSFPVAAEVVSSTPASFEITQTVTVNKSRAVVWAMLRSPQKWWAKEHSYSGNNANFYLDAQATGCFCEKLPGKGSVEHARVVFVSAPSMMRLQGALGPLQAEAVTGTLTYTLEDQGENATRVTISYIVGGYVRGGADAIAPAVDEVMAVQLLNLKSASEAAADDAETAK